MLLQAQPSILSVAHSISRKRSHSDALGREDTGTHCDRGTLHSTEQIWNDTCGILDITAKKNKPDRILDDAIEDDNTFHGDIATNPTAADITGDRSTTDNDLINEGHIDEGVGDEESICSWETINPGDIKIKTLWGREYPINEWQPHDTKRAEVWDLWFVRILIEFPILTRKCGIVESLDLRTFEKSSRDFVHLRDLKGRISNWGEFAKEIFNVLKPGGVAEFHEGTIQFKAKAELPENSFMKEWGDLFRKAGAERGARFDIIQSGILLNSLRAAGFSEIREYPYDVPIEPSQQQGELGQLAWLESVDDIEGSILRLAVENLGWSEERCYMFAAGLRNELKKTTVKPYMTRLAIVCKKPST
uniref:Methyltransferase tdiE n=1 Tax=Fusarium oxysporum (strain Fo5176) TaxID=660025 RepID=A0A0C4BKV8_FUSOF